MEDDAPETTPGYRVGEKKAVTEYLQMDSEDESLRKYKEALLGKAGDLGDPSDPRRVIITEMKVIINGHNPIVYDLSKKDSEKDMHNKPFTLKEKCEYKIQVSFKVQHEIITGLKLLNLVYKKGVRVAKEEEMLGSFPPGKDIHNVVFPRNGWDEAPSGMLSRGSYKGKHRFIDDDGKVHLEYEYAFAIKKDWNEAD
jgi:Rho GDP-dissociation inhibitor